MRRGGKQQPCAISFWEVAMLAGRKRVVLPGSPSEWRSDLLQAGLQEIPLDGRIALLSTQLEKLHRDPADRFIVATALQYQATLVTADSKILAWKSELARQDARN
jgi:PIN domain nuclease of toxin-antitoxin system